MYMIYLHFLSHTGVKGRSYLDKKRVRLVHPWNMGAPATHMLAPGRAEEGILVDGDCIRLGENVISMCDKPRG
jgi:hypothetical protein